MCHWFLTYGRNLDHYGITVSEIKRRVYEAEHKLTWQEQRRYDTQQNVRDEIGRISEALNHERNTFERIKLQQKLDLLVSKVDDEFDMDGITSIDQIKESSREKKIIIDRNFGPGKRLDFEKPLNINMSQRRNAVIDRNTLVVV
ncbi:hypothetical protein D3C86_1706090 [compost metagenome]